MKIPDNHIYGIAHRAVSSDIDSPIRYAIGRSITEAEGNELYQAMLSVVDEVLRNFEFDDGEPEPEIDSIQIWADDHKGESYKRPKGHVIYTVSGNCIKYRHGIVTGFVGVEVRRSSDGELAPMSIKDLEAMVKIDNQQQGGQHDAE